MLLMAVATLVVTLADGTATAKQNGKDRDTYNFKGTIQQVAEDGSRVVVDVTDGNKRARNHLGVQQFDVSEDTKIQVNEEKVELSALVVGDEVKIQSKAA